MTCDHIFVLSKTFTSSEMEEMMRGRVGLFVTSNVKQVAPFWMQ
jgi:hypothetical protein